MRVLAGERPPRVGDLIGYPYPFIGKRVLVVGVKKNEIHESWTIYILNLARMEKATTGFWATDLYDLVSEAEIP